MLCLSYFYYNKNISPFVNAYYLKDISDLRYNEEWLDFVVHCGNDGTHNYYVVERFMVDDTIYVEINE